MRGLLTLIILGAIAFFGYGFYDAKHLQRITDKVRVAAVVDTWHTVNWDSGQFWGPNGVQHGNIFVQINISNDSDQIIRRLDLHGLLMQDGKQLEVVDKRCQNKNSEELALPPRTEFAKGLNGYGDNGMVCFIKLNYLFPSDPGANIVDDAHDAERERVWALVRSVSLDDWYIEAWGTNPPMNAVTWLETTWSEFSAGVGNFVSYPFRRDTAPA
jgi:hypothetical protein